MRAGAIPTSFKMHGNGLFKGKEALLLVSRLKRG